MDTVTKNLMSKTAAYIEATQPLLDTYNEQRTSFVKRATQAAGVLAHRGIIARDAADQFVSKVAEDPSAIWEFVEKLASCIGVDALGEPSAEKTAETVKDPFERWVLFGDPRATGRKSGMID